MTMIENGARRMVYALTDTGSLWKDQRLALYPGMDYQVDATNDPERSRVIEVNGLQRPQLALTAFLDRLAEEGIIRFVDEPVPAKRDVSTVTAGVSMASKVTREEIDAAPNATGVTPEDAKNIVISAATAAKV